jgi:hypothetical protein
MQGSVAVSRSPERTTSFDVDGREGEAVAWMPPLIAVRRRMREEKMLMVSDGFILDIGNPEYRSSGSCG